MILKVQISLATSHVERQVLVYDRSRTIVFEGPLKYFPSLKDKMGSLKKAYFEAELVANAPDDYQIVLGDKLPDERW